MVHRTEREPGPEASCADRAIRKHLIDVDPLTCISLGGIPHFGLPSIVTEYLLYDYSLESETGTYAPDNNLRLNDGKTTLSGGKSRISRGRQHQSWGH